MESSKIKNFVIIVLILLNVFFLIIAVSDFVRGKAEKNEMQSQLVMVMAQNGISLDPDVIADNVELGFLHRKNAFWTVKRPSRRFFWVKRLWNPRGEISISMKATAAGLFSAAAENLKSS